MILRIAAGFSLAVGTIVLLGYFWWIGARAYEASGINGQSILVYPKARIVIAVNSAWPRPDAPELFRALQRFQGATYDAVMAQTKP